MRALLVTTGSRGDTEPFVALARALGKRGHSPIVAAPARFARLAAEHGVSFHGLDDSLLDLQDTLTNGGTWQAITGASKARAAFGRYLTDVASLTDLAADVVVYHPKTLAAPMVAEHQGVPAVAAQLIPLYQSTAEFPAPVAPTHTPRALNQASWQLVPLIEAPWRRTLGRLRRKQFGLATALPSMSRRIREHGALNAWSPHLLPAPMEWDANDAPLGFWRLPTPEWSPPASLVDFLDAGSPPVYIGFGSMVHRHPLELGQAVAEALRITERRGIVATGSGALTAAGSDAVFVLDHAPHAWLFSRVAAAVHHGGVGTVAAALTSGIPQVIKPFLGDQHFWSRRAEDIGVSVPLHSLKPEAIAEAITTTVDTLTPRAQAVGQDVRKDHGLDVAIDRLEQLVTGRS